MGWHAACCRKRMGDSSSTNRATCPMGPWSSWGFTRPRRSLPMRWRSSMESCNRRSRFYRLWEAVTDGRAEQIPPLRAQLLAALEREQTDRVKDWDALRDALRRLSQVPSSDIRRQDLSRLELAVFGARLPRPRRPSAPDVGPAPLRVGRLTLAAALRRSSGHRPARELTGRCFQHLRRASGAI